MTMAQSKPVIHLVGGVIHRDDQILVVYQQRTTDANGWWSMPGGTVEDGEMLASALVREVREETGVQVIDPGRVVLITELKYLKENQTVLAFVFDVAQWQGEVRPADPDGFVSHAQFMPIAQVAANYERHTWGLVTEPIIAYLTGKAVVGSVWTYHWDANENISLVARFPAESKEG